MPDPLHALLLDCGLSEDAAFAMCERAAIYQYESGLSRRDAELKATGGVAAENTKETEHVQRPS